MDRVQRRRDALKRVVYTLKKKIEDLTTNEITTEIRQEILANKTLLKEKEMDLKELQEQIFDKLEPEEFEKEMDDHTEFELDIRRLEEKLKTILEVESQCLPVKCPSETSSEAKNHHEKQNIRLPKLEIKKFGGEPTEWTQFYETFESAIHKNTNISAVEKFAYLKGYLFDDAANAINGFSLTNNNYEKALELLKERFGNEKLIVSTHMNNLLKIKPVTRDRDVKGLRTLYDNIESQARSLESLGIDSKNYGALLAPVIMEKIPHYIRLIINRKVKEWDLKQMLDVLREELQARENCTNITNEEEKQDPRKNNFNSYSFGDTRPSTASNLFVGTPSCVFCKGQHFSDKCSVITDVGARREFLKKGGRCFLCLQSGHMLRDCSRKKVCYYCKKNSHHSAICDSMSKTTNLCNHSTAVEKKVCNAEETPKVCHNKVQKKVTFETSTESSQPTSDMNTLHCKAQKNAKKEFSTHENNMQRTYLLQTAEAFMTSPRNQNVKIRLLLDSGSQRTYVSSKLVKNIGLKSTSSEKLCLSTFGNQRTQTQTLNVFELSIRPTTSNERINLRAIAIDHICNPVSGQDFAWSIGQYEHLQDLQLADAGSGELEIDILVGNDHYWDIITGDIIHSHSGPTAMSSKLGWVLSGPTQKANSTNINHVHTMKVNLQQEPETLENQVKMFWDLETLGIKAIETDVIEEVIEKITVNNEGRYEVSLPFKENSPMLPDNFTACKQRLMNLYRKLQKDPEQLRAYDHIMKEQAKNGIVEPASAPGSLGQVHYLPHHGVTRNDKETTKLRIVYDASSTSSSKTPSLNDCLYKGPQLNPLLYEVLVLFRTFPIALTSDIEKAFLQISVNPSERDFLRFLWFDDVFADEPRITRHRFARLIFGVNSSPFLLTGTMRKHLSTYNDIDPEFVRKVTKAFHVDDFTSGEFTLEDSFELYKKLKVRFAEANFNLRKWRTNDSKLRELINKSESITSPNSDSNAPNNKMSANDLHEHTGNTAESTAPKHLGIPWNEKSDELLFYLRETINQASNESPTKRNVLKAIASFYDPLGLIQPIIVSLKVLFQQICKTQCEWDEEIADDLRRKWISVIHELQQVDIIRVNRPYTIVEPSDPVVKYELHGFSDASQQAYGACVYLRTITRSHTINCSLVTSKTRVAPLKPTTIPRLELLGNLVLAELINTVSLIFKDELRIDRTIYWTDSQITLAWIRSFKKEFKTFVENRLRKIRSLSAIEDWRFIDTNSNPADLITRIINPTQLVNNTLWFHGPDFLSTTESEWPNTPEIAPPTEHSETKPTIVNTVTTTTTSISQIVHIDNFSSANRLYRVTAWILRFANNASHKRKKLSRNASQSLTASELQHSEKLWIKDNQHVLQNLPNIEQIKMQLNVIKDSDNILRCSGRLRHAPLPYETRSPVLITKHHRLAELLVSQAHKNVKHQKTKQTLTELRERFWICQGRSFVKQILHKCNTCRLLDAKAYKYPDIPPLTELRLSDHRAFYATGIDNFGPLFVKTTQDDNGVIYKLWGTVYTCASSRGIVLDLVPNISSQAFIRSLNRFVARRGCPDHIISDNGSNFIAIDTQNYAANKRITWHLNLPLAPWHGGFFERMIRTIKTILKKELRNARLTYEELSTLFFEIEQIVNNRPLTYVYPSDFESCVTPNHLLFGRRLESISYSSTEFDPTCHPTISTEHIQSILTHFWDRWRHEYLSELRENHKSFRNASPSTGLHVEVGDVVIIHEEFIPRHLWRLGKVTKLVESKDGSVRGAEVLVGKTGSLIKRPVTKLFPIEYIRSSIKESDNDTNSPINEHSIKNNDVSNEIQSGTRRSKREAAIMADLKRQLAEAGV